MLQISTLLFPDRETPHPFKSCVVLGFITDKEGRKQKQAAEELRAADGGARQVQCGRRALGASRQLRPGSQHEIRRLDCEGVDGAISC